MIGGDSLESIVAFEGIPWKLLGLMCSFTFLQKPGIILLKEGTDTSQGVPQLVSNINACQYIADAVRTTLGPRGMDKLIVDSGGDYEHVNTLIGGVRD